MATLDVLMLHDNLDEAREAVRRLRWSELDMALTACVSTSEQAMRIMKTHNVDILIADVGARLGDDILVDLLAEKSPEVLIVVIAHPPKMDCVLLAMRHQSVYDFVQMPLDTEELTRVLKSAGKYWHDWSLSLAIRQLTDMHRFHLPLEQKKAIDAEIKHILKSTAQTDVEEMAQGVGTLFQSLVCPPRQPDILLAQAVAVELLAQLKYLLISMGLDYNDEFALYSFVHKIRRAQNGADLEDLCMHYLRRCISMISPGLDQQQMSALVRTALQITKEKYSDSSFTLVSLADEIGISPNYLSSVFRMETGMRFKKYLNTYRIDKAKELLLDGRYKIYEVSDLVGIEDSRYFSQIFKTYMGMKPSDYRNSR